MNEKIDFIYKYVPTVCELKYFSVTGKVDPRQVYSGKGFVECPNELMLTDILDFLDRNNRSNVWGHLLLLWKKKSKKIEDQDEDCIVFVHNIVESIVFSYEN